MEPNYDKNLKGRTKQECKILDRHIYITGTYIKNSDTMIIMIILRQSERSKFELKLSPLFALRKIALSFDIPPHFLSPKGWALLELTYTNALQYSKAEKINVEINIKKISS